MDQSNTLVGNGSTIVAELTTMATTTSEEPFDVTLRCGHDALTDGPYIEARGFR